MDIKTSRQDFEGGIILGAGYCSDLFNALYYDLRATGLNNYYNHGYYGWNWSIYDVVLEGLKVNIYTINAYRNSPRKSDEAGYIEKAIKRTLNNFKNKLKALNSWRDEEALRSKYRKLLAKKINAAHEAYYKVAR